MKAKASTTKVSKVVAATRGWLRVPVGVHAVGPPKPPTAEATPTPAAAHHGAAHTPKQTKAPPAKEGPPTAPLAKEAPQAEPEKAAIEKLKVLTHHYYERKHTLAATVGELKGEIQAVTAQLTKDRAELLEKEGPCETVKP